MELRELFEAADTDKGGALEIEEFTEAFGGVLGKDMNPKQLKQLFMKIDADSNGSVEWHEFMNYMLLENQTLSSMKQEHFEYVKSNKPDPPPKSERSCHNDMITSIIIIIAPFSHHHYFSLDLSIFNKCSLSIIPSNILSSFVTNKH